MLCCVMQPVRGGTNPGPFGSESRSGTQSPVSVFKGLQWLYRNVDGKMVFALRILFGTVQVELVAGAICTLIAAFGKPAAEEAVPGVAYLLHMYVKCSYCKAARRHFH